MVACSFPDERQARAVGHNERIWRQCVESIGGCNVCSCRDGCALYGGWSDRPRRYSWCGSLRARASGFRLSLSGTFVRICFSAAATSHGIHGCEASSRRRTDGSAAARQELLLSNMESNASTPLPAPAIACSRWTKSDSVSQPSLRATSTLSSSWLEIQTRFFNPLESRRRR